jgi:hypothetical protein
MSKYGTAPAAQRTYNGIRFDSKAEMNRYLILRALERAGKIRDIELQPEFVLIPGFNHPHFGKMRAVRYRADFRYEEIISGRKIVEDVKGCVTDSYRIKRTLLLWRFPYIDFVEIPA